MSYVLGTLVRVSATFAVNGVATDPTVVTFKIKVPGGAVTTYVYGTDAQLVRDSVGAYHVDWTTAAEGIHYWRMAGTGAAIGAEEDQFTVADSRFTT